MKGYVVTEGFLPSATLKLYDYKATYAPEPTKINGKRILVNLTGKKKTYPFTILSVSGNATNMTVDRISPVVASGINAVWFASAGQTSVTTDCY